MFVMKTAIPLASTQPAPSRGRYAYSVFRTAISYKWFIEWAM
jgi:hypothetical protein